jgi:hypothetical protein
MASRYGLKNSDESRVTSDKQKTALLAARSFPRKRESTGRSHSRAFKSSAFFAPSAVDGFATGCQRLATVRTYSAGRQLLSTEATENGEQDRSPLPM